MKVEWRLCKCYEVLQKLYEYRTQIVQMVERVVRTKIMQRLRDYAREMVNVKVEKGWSNCWLLYESWMNICKDYEIVRTLYEWCVNCWGLYNSCTKRCECCARCELQESVLQRWCEGKRVVWSVDGSDLESYVGCIHVSCMLLTYCQGLLHIGLSRTSGFTTDIIYMFKFVQLCSMKNIQAVMTYNFEDRQG